PSMRGILEIMRQVASGLAAIHSMGILHRDLSPNNILVTRDGVAKIIDLGLSKVTTHASTAETRGHLAGTLAYVSPEQIDGKEAGVSAEVFAFGTILYEALAGVHPFHAEHQMTLLFNIQQREVPSISTYVANCPPGLSELVTKCLEKDPE